MEAQWPRIRVVTESTNSVFLQWLSYEARRLGLYVVQRQGSVETVALYLDFLPPTPLLAPSQKPPRDSAFYVRLDVPPGYPPEAAIQLQREAGRLAKELLKRLGYSIPQRLRSSHLTSMANELRVADGQLPSRAIYDIIDDIYKDKDLSKDQQRRKLIISRRHQLHKRLVKPYESGA